ncbi:Sec-independent protein translocase protein TatB [Luteimicrobium sp. DT211]|uniref:Sec-independent protein translocase protein TatB n=1 Tax=Luteimicrobium sp. DT211 TaxID=3393412 RepID=UPI003CEB40B4
MADVNGGELLVILVVAIVVIGPTRLPRYAEEAGRWVRRARDVARGLRARVDDELGADGVDWSALDPRQYDPRRVVRDALAAPTDPHHPEQGDSHAA